MSEPPGSIVLFRRVPTGVRPAALERYARVLRDDVADGRPFECLITNDREVRRLNLDFRGKDAATDVLSFPADVAQTFVSAFVPTLAEPVPTRQAPRRISARQTKMSAPQAFLGSLAVSWQRAAAQSREFGHSLEAELRILMLHGILHLLGMDHEIDRGRMARAESRWRAQLRLPDGLIERARR